MDLVDARTHVRRLRIELPPPPDPARWRGLNVVFGPGGRDVIVQHVYDPTDPQSPASVLRRYAGATGRAVGPPVRVGRRPTVLMWSTADRRRLFVTSREDGETYMLDAERLRILRRWPVGDVAGTVSSDGSVFALGSPDGAVRLLDLRAGRVRSFSGGHEEAVLRMQFSAGGGTLVTPETTDR